MFGKTIMRVISYAVAGAIAVLLGGRLLSSVASVVLAWRLGNPLPLAVVTVGTVLLVFLSRGEATTLPLMILNIISWIASAYMSVVVFFVALPFGLILGFTAMAVSLIAVSVVKDTRGLGGRVRSMIERTAILGASIPLLGHEMDDSGMLSSLGRRNFVAFLVSRNERGRILQLMRERPLLPISLSGYEETDILFVRDDGANAAQIEVLLRDAGVDGLEKLSSFHTSAVLNLPLIEKREEVHTPSEYVFCHDVATVDRLVEVWPKRMTLHPSRSGVIAIASEDAVPGFETQPIPRGLRSTVVMERNVSLLEAGGKDVAAEPAA